MMEQNWSSIVTGPTRHQDRVSNAFDGTTSGPGAIPAYPGTLTFAPGLISISSVKIYGYYAGSGVTLHVNGSQQSPSSGAFTLTISTSTLDSVVWTATNGFNYIRIDAIEVDSTVLIDPVVVHLMIVMQTQPPSTHSTLISTQFVGKRLVMLLLILLILDMMVHQ